MVESGYSQFTPPAPDVDALTCSDFHLALTNEKPSSLADTNAGDTERLMARLSAAKSPGVVAFQDALKSLDHLANRPARLAIDTDSIYIPPRRRRRIGKKRGGRPVRPLAQKQLPLYSPMTFSYFGRCFRQASFGSSPQEAGSLRHGALLAQTPGLPIPS